MSSIFPQPQTVAEPRRWRLAGLLTAITALVTACKSPPQTPTASPSAQDSVLPGTETVHTSSASTARAYRQDAARHLYERSTGRIYQGKLPPMLYAIGVLDVEIDRAGRVTALHWKRAPNHAPEVVAEIERIARAAAPYPAPQRMGRVTYTDVWLWDKSGHFQLDTLTEGQM